MMGRCELEVAADGIAALEEQRTCSTSIASLARLSIGR
jgi:hypothetical protein